MTSCKTAKNLEVESNKYDQVHKDSRLNKIQMGNKPNYTTRPDIETPVRAGPRRSSISESAYRQVIMLYESADILGDFCVKWFVKH